jgi:eukaryotic-like serine/threonine-protein kinase
VTSVDGANDQASSEDEDEDAEATLCSEGLVPPPINKRLTPTRQLGWRPGQRIGGQRIVEKLGKGSSGAVYLVEDPESKELRALKAIPSPNDEARRRFEREVNCQLDASGHPNVAECYGAGEWQGNVFLVAEFLPGGSLREQLQAEGPFEPRRAAEIVAALADGLGAVHANGVLHRDLKPANVMFDEEGVPKLVDFGLAAAGGDADDMFGTPVFMAPEQTRTAQAPLSVRTDVYGLGAVLYSALTGALPYATKSLMDLLLEIAACDPVPPSERAPQQEIPEALDEIVLRAMARKPDDRYASAAEFAAALRAFLDASA